MMPKFEYQSTVLSQLVILTFVGDSFELLGNTNYGYQKLPWSGKGQNFLKGEKSVVKCAGGSRGELVGR